MRNALAIARKELSIYFTTPWAYVVFTAMVGITAFFFVGSLSFFRTINELAKGMGWARLPGEYQAFKNLTDGVIAPLWGVMIVITAIIAPILSMRLFAEEKRNKTFELLMTAPVRPIEIVLGKYLGGLVIVTTTLGLTILFPLILSMYGKSESGSALEWSTILLGYLAVLLYGASCLAVGMFVSSLTESQMLAGVITIIVMLALLLVKGLTQTADEPLRSIVGYLSFDTQLQNLMKGVLDLKAIVYVASISVFFIFLTHRSVEAQRWS